MPDPLIPPEATIRVHRCAVCGQLWARRPYAHTTFRWGSELCTGTPAERVYVDPAAVDREVWAKRVARVLDPVHRRPLATDEALSRAVVDALLGPEDDRAQ